MSGFLDREGLLLLWGKIKGLLANKVDAVEGKQLSANDYTNEEKTRLMDLENYTHPTDSGYRHIPAGGADGQILRWAEDGAAIWNDPQELALEGFTAADIATDEEGVSVQAALDGNAALTHAAQHATGGADAITPGDIGAAPADHASSGTTHGRATATLYGHARSANAAPQAPSISGSAGIDNGIHANANHSHPHGNALYTGDGAYATIIRTSGALTPNGTAAGQNLGDGSNRWATAYLAANPNVSSDRRIKRNIEDISEALPLIMALEPKKYQRTDMPDSEKVYYGLIAQDAKAAMEALGITNTDIWRRDSIVDGVSTEEATEEQVRYSLAYTELIPLLIAVVQQQEKRIAALEAAGGGGDD